MGDDTHYRIYEAHTSRGMSVSFLIGQSDHCRLGFATPRHLLITPSGISNARAQWVLILKINIAAAREKKLYGFQRKMVFIAFKSYGRRLYPCGLEIGDPNLPVIHNLTPVM